jgi:transposase
MNAFSVLTLVCARLIADKAYGADERVLKSLASAGKSIVIPPRQNRTAPHHFDAALYQTRHLIENFFCKLSQFRDSSATSPHAKPKPPEISSPRSTSPATTIWLN